MSYHLGRISAYASIGLLFGFIGRGFYLAGLQQQLSVFAGITMIAIIVLPERIFAKYNFSRPIYKVVSAIKTNLGSQFKKQSFRSIYSIGLLNGFLPCGMVYAAVFGALAMPRVETGIMYMILFGLGTVPLMSSVVYLQRLVTLPLRNRIQKVIPYAVICIGVLFILRGMGLGIPYISPATISMHVQALPDCH